MRLPNNQASVRRVLRFEPDLGLMLLVILLLTLGWGTIRSLWAIRRWRTCLPPGQVTGEETTHLPRSQPPPPADGRRQAVV